METNYFSIIMAVIVIIVIAMIPFFYIQAYKDDIRSLKEEIKILEETILSYERTVRDYQTILLSHRYINERIIKIKNLKDGTSKDQQTGARGDV